MDDDDGDGDTDLISFGQEKKEFSTPWICYCAALISTSPRCAGMMAEVKQCRTCNRQINWARINGSRVGNLVDQSNL